MADCISDYIESGVTTNLSRNEQLALTVKVVKFLAEYLKAMEIPVTLNTLLNNFGMISQAVDNHFPGYAEARLIRYIITPNRTQLEKEIA